MDWPELVVARRARPHQASPDQINALRAVVSRDLADANLPGLSPDRRFATAYNAALQVSTIAILCSGYRITGQHHHATTFEALQLALGMPGYEFSLFFDACRRKRNMLDYDQADVATLTEARQLIEEVVRFRELVERWIAREHSEYSTAI
jgi:hypothetical protein